MTHQGVRWRKRYPGGIESLTSGQSATLVDPAGSCRGEGPLDVLLNRGYRKVPAMIATWHSDKELRACLCLAVLSSDHDKVSSDRKISL